MGNNIEEVVVDDDEELNDGENDGGNDFGIFEKEMDQINLLSSQDDTNEGNI